MEKYESQHEKLLSPAEDIIEHKQFNHVMRKPIFRDKATNASSYSLEF